MLYVLYDVIPVKIGCVHDLSMNYDVAKVKKVRKRIIATNNGS